MYFAWLICACVTLLSIITPAVGGSESSYLLKLQQLRRAAREEQQHQQETTPIVRSAKPKSTNDNKKVNRYKCVLIEDDDDEIFKNGSLNSEQSFIKVIPQNEEEKFRILNSLNFASEVSRTYGESFEEAGSDLLYLTSTTPIPINSPLSIKKLNNGKKASTASIGKIDSSQKTHVHALPVAHVTPLRNAIGGGHDSLQHVETPSRDINTAEEYLYQSTRRRFISNPTTTTPSSANNDNNRLKLGEQQCKMIMHYASLYNVKDIKGWVHHNCAFAKMYLPNATCAEIDILVASCFD